VICLDLPENRSSVLSSTSKCSLKLLGFANRQDKFVTFYPVNNRKKPGKKDPGFYQFQYAIRLIY
tara:strand:- start:1370 stop:1564 length:195 start_codon:yes stop_codon:yes gene_type:complete